MWTTSWTWRRTSSSRRRRRWTKATRVEIQRSVFAQILHCPHSASAQAAQPILSLKGQRITLSSRARRSPPRPRRRPHALAHRHSRQHERCMTIAHTYNHHRSQLRRVWQPHDESPHSRATLPGTVPRACSAAAAAGEKDDECEAFKNARRSPSEHAPARPPQTNSGVAVRLIAFPTHVEVGLTDFSARGTLSRSLVATASSTPFGAEFANRFCAQPRCGQRTAESSRTSPGAHWNAVTPHSRSPGRPAARPPTGLDIALEADVGVARSLSRARLRPWLSL